MIIFGASGDLTKRKLMPALYALYKDNRLPEDFAVLGIGRTEYQDDTYRTYIRTEMERFVTPEEHADNRMPTSATVCTTSRSIPPKPPITASWPPACRS